MFPTTALSRTPLGSPAALQHALASSFPFPHTATECTRSVSRVAMMSLHSQSPVASPGGHIQHHLQMEHLHLRQTLLHSPLYAFPTSAAKSQTDQHLESDPPKAAPPNHIFRDITMAPVANPTRKALRPSFIQLPRNELMDLPKDISAVRFAGMGIAATIRDDTGKCTLKNRVPTPYPREDAKFRWEEDLASDTDEV
ncbi:hypothetical protein FRB99_008565 [Tulasnella sp. 403]|nr:hypothetical protein FRB99_008565 [Tulasnella sp. 403]